MRDVVTGFYKDVLARLIVAGTLSISDSVLIVRAGPLDEGSDRASMAHAHPHPPPTTRPPARMLADLFMATSTPVRSPSASAIRTIPTDGSGAAASIRDRIRASIRAAPPPASTRPAPILRAHGRSFCQSAPRQIFRRGAISGIGPPENMRCGMQAKSWSTCADDLASCTAKGASWLDQRSDLGICR